MRASTRRWTDEELEGWIGGLLRAGVALAAVVALLGGVFYAREYGGTRVDFSVFRGESHGLDSVSGILSGLLALRTPALVQFGLLLLIATPVARVLLSLLAFAAQRDRLYVAVTGVVLALLLFGLLGA